MFGGGFRWDQGEDEAFTRHVREIHKLKDGFNPIAKTLHNLMESTRDSAKVQMKASSFYKKGGAVADDQDLGAAMVQMGNLLESLGGALTQSIEETTGQHLYTQTNEFLHKELPHSKAAKDRFTTAKKTAKNRDSHLKKLQKKRDPNPAKVQEAEESKVDADRELVKFRAELQLSLERFDTRKVTMRDSMSHYMDEQIKHHQKSLDILYAARDKLQTHQEACATRADARGPSPNAGLTGGAGASSSSAAAAAPPPFRPAGSTPSSPSFASQGGASSPRGDPGLNRSNTTASSTSTGSSIGHPNGPPPPSRPPAAPLGRSASGPRGMPLDQAQMQLSPKHQHTESIDENGSPAGSTSRSPPQPPAWLRPSSPQHKPPSHPSPELKPLEPNKLSKAPDLTYNALLAAHKHMSMKHLGAHSANSSWDSQGEGRTSKRSSHSRSSSYDPGAAPRRPSAVASGGPPPPPAFMSATSAGAPPPVPPAAARGSLPALGGLPGLPPANAPPMRKSPSSISGAYSAHHRQNEGARFRGDSDSSDSSGYDSDE